VIDYAHLDHPSRPQAPAVALVRDRAANRSAAGVALDWVAFFIRRWGDRWFAVNDAEAYWWGWQVTKTLGGLRRRYRDLRFDTLAPGEAR
jgi:hypothetical protein